LKAAQKVQKRAGDVDAAFGKALLLSAYEPLQARRMMLVLRTHDVDERRPEYAAHGIIRVNAGEQVELVQGEVTVGLPPPYSEYVLVKTATGKVGKVGKMCFF
jgi:hypothetical protein